jgi:hypothetical protein
MVSFEAYVPISIPVSDIDFVWIRKVNFLATMGLDVLVPIGIFFGSISYEYPKVTMLNPR